MVLLRKILLKKAAALVATEKSDIVRVALKMDCLILSPLKPKSAFLYIHSIKCPADLLYNHNEKHTIRIYYIEKG
jgi:hypothetical protein